MGANGSAERLEEGSRVSSRFEERVAEERPASNGQ